MSTWVHNSFQFNWNQLRFRSDNPKIRHMYWENNSFKGTEWFNLQNYIIAQDIMLVKPI